MTVSDFLYKHALCPSQILAEDCLGSLLSAMEQGLRGEGNIPMLPSYLSAAMQPPRNAGCCVLDAGGTNLRSAKATFDDTGNCHIENIHQTAMPGTSAPMGKDAFYSAIAQHAVLAGAMERVGFCFSYNVQMERHLDGRLLAWCKEVQVPEAVGRPVGASLKKAMGDTCRSVHVLNDSVAAMLGAATPGTPVQVGIILGTGVNVCYEERCAAIAKVEGDLLADSMIISTEVGEFDGIPKSDFDTALFAATEDPSLAHAEKQCAGGYLGELICRVWQGGAREGVLDAAFDGITATLPEISAMLEGRETAIPQSDDACLIARTLIHRAAKIAAILCAGPVLRCASTQVNIAVEGSQFSKLFGFRAHFTEELKSILQPKGIAFSFVQADHTCLKGAALAAFAKTM